HAAEEISQRGRTFLGVMGVFDVGALCIANSERASDLILKGNCSCSSLAHPSRRDEPDQQPRSDERGRVYEERSIISETRRRYAPEGRAQSELQEPRRIHHDVCSQYLPRGDEVGQCCVLCPPKEHRE